MALNGKAMELGRFAYDVGLVDTDENNVKLNPKDINVLYRKTAEGMRTQYDQSRSGAAIQNDRIHVLDIINQFQKSKDELLAGGIDDAVSPVDRSSFTPRITSLYGMRQLQGEPSPRPHVGVDIALEGGGGSPIRAVLGGVVVFSGVVSGYGEYIVIRHDATKDNKPVYTSYAHLAQRYVAGGRVTRGQEIGFMGGTSGGPKQFAVHLHFEVAVGGPMNMSQSERFKVFSVNPESFFKSIKDLGRSGNASVGMTHEAMDADDSEIARYYAAKRRDYK